MKITTWNVNGLRAVFRKKALDWVDEYQTDVLCLQEIKAKPDQLSEKEHAKFAGYEAAWNPAERPGYSGVLTLHKTAPQQTVNGFGVEQFDIEGRVIQSHFEHFILFNIYFPNGGRDLKRVPYKLEFYDELLKLCDQLHADGKQVIICGDFNTSHNEIDLANPKPNEKNTGFLREERDWIDKYIEHGLVDAYRVLYPDKVEYTWWTYISNARARNVGWRLDYFMISESLMPRVKDVVNHNEIMGSDHCPVTLVLE
jgi:exodeoxyribonuclease-3